jgi:hypothetical protein
MALLAKRLPDVSSAALEGGIIRDGTFQEYFSQLSNQFPSASFAETAGKTPSVIGQAIPKLGSSHRNVLSAAGA